MIASIWHTRVPDTIGSALTAPPARAALTLRGDRRTAADAAADDEGDMGPPLVLACGCFLPERSGTRPD